MIFLWVVFGAMVMTAVYSFGARRDIHRWAYSRYAMAVLNLIFAVGAKAVGYSIWLCMVFVLLAIMNIMIAKRVRSVHEKAGTQDKG